MSMVEILNDRQGFCIYDNAQTINESKKLIVHNIKNIFEKNNNLACYSIFLTTFFFDTIFESYLQSYVGKVNINDKNIIRNMIEKTLDIKLNDYMNEIELLEMYNYCKSYILILMKE